MQQLLGDYEAFINAISTGLGGLSINKEELVMMDHLCYRVETIERYAQLKQQLHESAELIAENQVNGREITTFEFINPLVAAGWIVPYLELPAPKEGSLYKEGLEHVEFVVMGGLDRFLKRHTELSFSDKGMSKAINPEASLKLEGDISVKFHEQPLGAVARIEKRLTEKGIDYES